MRFIDSAIVLAFITAFLYCASTAFTHGYLGVFHLDSDVLVRDFHQIIYHGMILNIWTIFGLPLFVALCISLHSSCALGLSNYLKKGFAKGRKFVALKKCFNFRTRKYSQLEKKHNKRVNVFWCIWIFAFIFFIAMALFETNGRKRALLAVEMIKNGSYNSVKINGRDTGKYLAFLYCGSKNCAAQNTKSTEYEIVYFPQSEHSIQIVTK